MWLSGTEQNLCVFRLWGPLCLQVAQWCLRMAEKEFSQLCAVWGSKKDTRAPDAKASMPWSLPLCSQPSGRRLLCSGFGNSIPPPEEEDFSTSGKPKAGS